MSVGERAECCSLEDTPQLYVKIIQVLDMLYNRFGHEWLKEYNVAKTERTSWLEKASQVAAIVGTVIAVIGFVSGQTSLPGLISLFPAHFVIPFPSFQLPTIPATVVRIISGTFTVFGALFYNGIIGWIASKIMGTDAQQGILLNILIGWLGSIVGNYLRTGLDIIGLITKPNPSAFTLYSFITSVFGACLILFGVGLFTGRRHINQSSAQLPGSANSNDKKP